MRRAMLGMVILLLLAGAMTSAQSELLQNPSLEEGSFGAYTTRRGGEFPIYLPNGWNAWLAGQSGEYLNRGDRTTISPHPGPGPDPQNGSRALNVNCGYVTCTVAIYQQVPVTEGENIQARAWSQVKACNIPKDGDNCGSAVESGARTRIGIDPNGGTDPGDSDIVWSNWSQPHDQWLEMSVSATTTGSTATLFLYSTQGNPADLNRTYWDNTSLTGGGAGGSAPGSPAATPVPTAPPSVPFVVRQGENEDGSITHTVVEGDTIDSIAVAYRLTRQEILALNPDISDPRIISLGQRIIIQEARAATPTDEPEDEPTPAPEDDVPSGGVNLEEEIPDAELTQTPAENDTETTDTPEETPVDEAPGTEDVPDTQPEVSDDSGQPSPATLTPAPVVAAALPASDPTALNAVVCISIFDDANQNRLREPAEALLAGGSIQFAASPEVSETFESGTDPYCMENVSPGSYTISATAPDGYGLTSPSQFRLQAQAGSHVTIAFGAAAGVETVAPPTADPNEPTPAGPIDASVEDPAASILDNIFNISGLLVFGLAGVVLLAGLGLTLFLRRR